MRKISFLVAVGEEDSIYSGVFNFANNLHNVIDNSEIILSDLLFKKTHSILKNIIVVHGVWDIRLLFVVMLVVPFKKIYWYPHGGFNSFVINKSNMLLKRIILWCILLFKRNIILLSTSDEEDMFSLCNNVTFSRVKLGCDKVNLLKVPSVNQCKLLCIGRMSEEKGIDFLVNALMQYKGNIACDIFIHENDHSPYDNSILSKYSITIYSKTLGSERWSTMVNYDALILPSFSESFGLVAAESLSLGLPILASSKTIWNNAEDERYGFVFDLNIESLHTAFDKFTYCNMDDLFIMGKFGRNYIHKNYSWGLISAQFKDKVR